MRQDALNPLPQCTLWISAQHQPDICPWCSCPSQPNFLADMWAYLTVVIGNCLQCWQRGLSDWVDRWMQTDCKMQDVPGVKKCMEAAQEVHRGIISTCESLCKHCHSRTVGSDKFWQGQQVANRVKWLVAWSTTLHWLLVIWQCK